MAKIPMQFFILFVGRHGVRVLSVRAAAAAVPERGHARSGIARAEASNTRPSEHASSRRSSGAKPRPSGWPKRGAAHDGGRRAGYLEQYRDAQQEIDGARIQGADALRAVGRRERLQRHQLHLSFVRDALSAGGCCGPADRGDFRRRHVVQLRRGQFAGHGHGDRYLQETPAAQRHRPPLFVGLAPGHGVLGVVRGVFRALREEAGIADRSRESAGIAVLRIAARRVRAGVLVPPGHGNGRVHRDAGR